MKHEEPMLSRQQVADILGVTIVQVWRYTKKGYLKNIQYIPKGKRYYFESEVMAFKAGKKNDQTTTPTTK